MPTVLISKIYSHSYWLLVVLFGFSQQVLAAESPAGAAAEKLPGNQDVQELIDAYKKREAKIRSLEVQWEEDVAEPLPNGLQRKYVRKWRVLVEGNKVRTEESGAPSDAGEKDVRSISAFDGTVGKRMMSADALNYALCIIDNKDGSEMLTVNNANLDCILFALLPSVVLNSRDLSRMDWTEQVGEMDGRPVKVLSRKAGYRQTQEEQLCIDTSSLLVKRATSKSQAMTVQWDIEYQDIDGQAMPVTWKWNSSYNDGKLHMARTSRAVKVTLNPVIAPAEFDIDFPVGARVRDSRVGKSYIVGPGGEKLSDAQADRIDAQIKAEAETADKKIKRLLGKPLVLAGNTPEGKQFSSDEYKGKVVLVHFWASFCQPCLAELPRIREAYKKYHDKGFEVLGVSYDTEIDSLTKYLAESKLPWVQLLDQPDARTKPTMMTKFAIRDSRDMFLIDKQGVCRSIRGLDDLDKLVPKLLAE
jgi:thiol-disulfide isomerase/thioredoxin